MERVVCSIKTLPPTPDEEIKSLSVMRRAKVSRRRKAPGKLLFDSNCDAENVSNSSQKIPCFLFLFHHFSLIKLTTYNFIFLDLIIQRIKSFLSPL